jgi:phage terminase small subunit
MDDLQIAWRPLCELIPYPMQSPYVAVANKQVDIIVRIAAELGMTPSSRTRIRVGEKAPADPFEAFLQGRG